MSEAIEQPEFKQDPPVIEQETFDGLNMRSEFREALREMGYTHPTPVQKAVYPVLMAGKDAMVESRTGTGKTVAFSLPLLQGLTGEALQALILAPTRELALQVADECKRLSKFSNLRIVPIYGGAPMKPQIDALADNPNVVAGTPGRVLDHLRRGTLKAQNIAFLVLDECDEMLSMGFQEELDAICEFLPPPGKRQTFLFSATIPESIERVAKRHLKDPEKISLSGGDVNISAISHYYYLVSGLSRTRDLLKVLKSEQPDSAIVFCNTREDTSTVAEYLNRNGYDAEAISGDLTQKERERVMERSKQKNLRFLVATDIAARGIDISDLSHVINYQFPESPENYVHRIGRTGRAGKQGIAISLVGPREIGAFYYLKLTYKIRPQERELPSAEELLTLQEGEQLLRVKELVPETPSATLVSLARRLWQSHGGEKVVASLLERLLHDQLPSHARSVIVKEAPAGASSSSGEAAKPATREPSRRFESDRPARPSRETRSEGRGGPRREGGRDNDRSRGDRPDRGGRDRDRGGRNRSESIDSRGPATERMKSPELSAATINTGGATPAGSSESVQATEFWETWADEKTKAQSKVPEQVPAADDDTNFTVRLYLNIGSKDGATIEDIQELLRNSLAGDAERVSSVILRTTQTYLRVPDAFAEKAIALLSGRTCKDRTVMVERARR